MANAWIQDTGCVASTIVAIATLAVTVVGYSRMDKTAVAATPSPCQSPSTLSVVVAPPPGHSTTLNPHAPFPSFSNASFQNAGLVATTVLAVASLAIAIAEYANNGDGSILQLPSPSLPYSPTLTPTFSLPSPSPSFQYQIPHPPIRRPHRGTTPKPITLPRLLLRH